MDRKCPSVFGRDFGRKRDLSVFWPMQIMRDMSLRTPFTLELRNVPYEAQRQIDFFIIERLPLFRAGKYDAGGNGGFLAEAAQLRFGERIEAVMLNEPWYRDNMPRMKAHFDDGTITAPRDRETSDDLRLIKLVRGVGRVPDERTGEVGKKRHGDAAIACALAVAASRAEPELYGYEGAPRELADESRGTGYFTTVEAANAADDEKGGGFIPELSRRIY
jgi:phage FluMu gp28-like protein